METVRQTHPLILVAAASVTALSLAGVASLAGWLPAGGNAPAAPAAAPPPALAQSGGAKAEGPATINVPAGATITVEPKPAPHASRRPAHAETQVARPPQATAAASPQPAYTRVATPVAGDNGIYVENARPAPASPQPAVCHDCGTVEAVREISNKGEGTGLGAVAGGVLGGLLGNQIGGGNGKKAMTVVGAAGGAFAGHEAEKHLRADKQYQITVRFDDGNTRTYTETAAPQFQSGDRVRLANGRLLPN